MGVAHFGSLADNEEAQQHFDASIPTDAVDLDSMLLSTHARKKGKAGHPRTAPTACPWWDVVSARPGPPPRARDAANRAGAICLTESMSDSSCGYVSALNGRLESYLLNDS